jgi:hypothetical protein
MTSFDEPIKVGQLPSPCVAAIHHPRDAESGLPATRHIERGIRGIVAERNAKRTLAFTRSQQPGNLLLIALSLESATPR